MTAPRRLHAEPPALPIITVDATHDGEEALLNALTERAESVPCRAVDNGIGAYECWGRRGVDVRMELESDDVAPFRVVVTGCGDDGVDAVVRVEVERTAEYRRGTVEGTIVLVATLAGYADGTAIYDVEGA